MPQIDFRSHADTLIIIRTLIRSLRIEGSSGFNAQNRKRQFAKIIPLYIDTIGICRRRELAHRRFESDIFTSQGIFEVYVERDAPL